jgi:hypothetical protein
MTIQLLGKDDANADDPEVMSGRWEAYIRSYTSVSLMYSYHQCQLMTISM